MNPKLPVCAALLGALALFQPCRLYVVSGDSMWPTLHSGEMVVGSLHPHRVARGDVVVFRHDGETVVKRVAFLAGDRIEEFNFVDEWQVALTPTSRASMVRRRCPRKEYVVPVGRFYALGDNLSGSIDSRAYGAVPLEDVVAILRGPSEPTPPPIAGRISPTMVARL